jgi:uncharacterized protein YoxC
MAENNAVTKEELKEILAEMTQEFQRDLTETNQNVAGLTQNVAGLTQNVAGLTQNVAGLTQNVAGLTQNVTGLTQKVAGLTQNVELQGKQLEEFRAETAARFDEADKKHAKVIDKIFALEDKMDAQYREFHETHAKLITGMDAMMKEHETIRYEQVSIGAIQDRQQREINGIKQNLGIDNKSNKSRVNSPKKKQSTRRRKKS